MKLQFVNADNPLPGDLMTTNIPHRLVSRYNPGAELFASSTLEGVVRLSSGSYSLIYRDSSGTLQGDAGTNAEISRRIGSIWGGAFIVLP